METIHTVYVGLGSNSPDAADRLLSALDVLSRLPGTVVSALSPVYRTEPQDYADQPWFLNRVLMLRVSGDITPVELMKRFLGIETLLGRVRSPDPALRFGPRDIDIDMLLFDDVVSDDPVCVLPHPRLSRRAFWLVPLLDIAPDIRIGGVRAERLLSRLKWRLEDDKIFQ